MKTSDKLEACADLLANPGGWTQGAYARDEDGKKVSAHSAHATCFCAVGALIRLYSTARADFWLGKGVNPSGDYSLLIAKWNDAPERTQEEVVAAFREAALLARKAGE